MTPPNFNSSKLRFRYHPWHVLRDWHSAVTTRPAGRRRAALPWPGLHGVTIKLQTVLLSRWAEKQGWSGAATGPLTHGQAGPAAAARGPARPGAQWIMTLPTPPAAGSSHWVHRVNLKLKCHARSSTRIPWPRDMPLSDWHARCQWYFKFFAGFSSLRQVWSPERAAGSRVVAKSLEALKVRASETLQASTDIRTDNNLLVTWINLPSCLLGPCRTPRVTARRRASRTDSWCAAAPILRPPQFGFFRVKFQVSLASFQVCQWSKRFFGIPAGPQCRSILRPAGAGGLLKFTGKFLLSIFHKKMWR
jgi:hypothetical protein